MFDVNSVGMRVVSDFFGEGVITHYHPHAPEIGVMFDRLKYQFEYARLKTVPDCYFNVDGTMSGFEANAMDNIRVVVVGKRSSLDELI